MRAQEFTMSEQAAMKWLRPGELRGSYSNSDLRRLGFRQAQSGAWFISQQRWQQLVQQGLIREDISSEQPTDPIQQAAVDFYVRNVGDAAAEPVEDYAAQARELIQQAAPSMRDRVRSVLRRARDNPYIQGGVITTVGAVLTGALLTSAQRMGLSPRETNVLLQAVLNTVIPTMVSRVNGRSWRETLKYTLASAGIGAGIAGMTEDSPTFNLRRRPLNVPELIKRGAIFITHPHGPQGWETDRPNWDFSLITLQNVLEKSPDWATQYRKYLKPESEPTAIQGDFFDRIGDEKYQQILWSIKKLGLPDSVAFTDSVDENFADGRVKGKSRPGRVKRAGASCKGSVTDLRKRAKKYGGERGRMYHWCANMKSGRARKK